jgi:hypothetical protein
MILTGVDIWVYASWMVLIAFNALGLIPMISAFRRGERRARPHRSRTDHRRLGQHVGLPSRVGRGEWGADRGSLLARPLPAAPRCRIRWCTGRHAGHRPSQVTCVTPRRTITGGLILFALPFSLMLLDDPQPLPVVDPGDYGHGMYIGCAGPDESIVWHKLFPSRSIPEETPDDMIAVDPEPLIRMRQAVIDEPDRYSLLTYPALERVPLEIEVLEPERIDVRPRSPLPLGAFVFIAPRESLYGGQDVFMFRVSGTPGTPQDPG